MLSKYIYQAMLSAVLSGVLLSACGGSSDSQNSSSSNSNTNPAQQTYAEISGTAFSNKSLADAKVNAICKDGSGFKSDVVTDEEGQWKGEVNSSQFPCRIEVQADRKYHGYVQKAGNVNLNLLTDFSIAYASAQMPETWYQSGTISDEKLKSAQLALLAELIKKGYILDKDVDIFNGEVKATDPIRQVVQDLFAAIQAGNTIKDYDDLLILVKDGNLSQIPVSNREPVKPLTIQLNTSACIPYDVGGIERYNYCSSNVFPDFKEDQLISAFGKKCILTKEGDVLSITDGELTISARINQEAEDAIIHKSIIGTLFVAVNPNPRDIEDVTYNVGISFDTSGQINSVTAGNDKGEALFCPTTRRPL